MNKNINIDVHHLTRVEGHGNIIVNIKDGTIEKCQWQVPEAPRFFEAMVRGRHYTEVSRITSRICGICSVGHTLASLKATENALGIEVSSKTKKLRTLLKHAENADSHILHVYFLVAPDLFGVKSVFPLASTHTEVVQRALRLKRVCHEWGSLIGGRTTHPTKPIVGGFSDYPTDKELQALKEKLLSAVPDLNITAETVLSVAEKIPDFHRPTEYVALNSTQEYGLYDGDIQTTMPDGKKESFKVNEYRLVTNEYVVPQSTAKYTKHNLESYTAGALARFNNNYNSLRSEAKAVANLFAMTPICTNPFLNSVAQLIETVHSFYEAIRLIDEILEEGCTEEAPVPPARFGSGAGSVEVPRGILFHEYAYDNEGMCIDGNCIIPTNQNHGNIQKDFEKLVPEMLESGKSEEEMKLTLEMLVRAYDPCISCSTHYLDINFIK